MASAAVDMGAMPTDDLFKSLDCGVDAIVSAALVETDARAKYVALISVFFFCSLVAAFSAQ